MGMQERFEQMIETTGCNPSLLGLLFKTGAYSLIEEDRIDRMIRGAIDCFGYNQTNKDGVVRHYVIAVGHIGTFSQFNLQDEKFEYVKYEHVGTTNTDQASAN